MNDESLKELKDNIIVDNHGTNVEMNHMGELLQVSKSQRLKSEKRVRLKLEKKAKFKEENMARLEKCWRREEARSDKCNSSPPDIDFNDVNTFKNSKSPKRVLVNKLAFPSKVQSEYRCKIVDNKKHKRRLCDLVRVEMILEHIVTPTSAPTLHSTLVPPNMLVPVELKFQSKRGCVRLVPEQTALDGKFYLKGMERNLSSW